jgi:hypothetical protein
MANQDSIFYKIGAQVRESINDSISSVPQLNGDNIFLGDNSFYGLVTAGSLHTFNITSGNTDLIEISAINTNATYDTHVLILNDNITTSTAAFISGKLTINVPSDQTNSTETISELADIIITAVGDDFSVRVYPGAGNVESKTVDAIYDGITPGTPTSTTALSGNTFRTLNNALFGKNVTITGDLTVNGATTTVQTTELDIQDNVITLSKGASQGNWYQDAGLFFERASELKSTAIIWDESEDVFVVGEIDSSGNSYEMTEFGVASGGNGVQFSLDGAATSDSQTTITSVSLGDSVAITNSSNSDYIFIKNPGGDEVLRIAPNATGVFTPLVIDTHNIFIGSESDYENSSLVVISSFDIQAASSTSDNSDVFNITPGPLKVGSLSITDASLGQQDLGDLSDFTAGLGS